MTVFLLGQRYVSAEIESVHIAHIIRSYVTLIIVVYILVKSLSY